MDKKKTITITLIVIVLIATFILLTTYAFWRLKDGQSGSNYVYGKCLSFEFVELEDENGKIGGFRLDNAEPISDEAGSALDGYTFKVENTCSDPVDYQVVLESLKIYNDAENAYYPESAYFADNKIKVQFDNETIRTYSDFEQVDDDAEDTSGEIRKTRELLVGTIPGKTDDPNDTSNVVTHNLKMWISSESTNADIGKIFRSKIKVFAGQNTPQYALTDESCFLFNESSQSIIGFDFNKCGTDAIVIPPTIGGVEVKNVIFPDTLGPVTVGHLDISNLTGVESFPVHAFEGITVNGGTLVIPEGVKVIGTFAFSTIYSDHLVLPSTLTDISDFAFSGYNGDDLILPSNLVLIGQSAFSSYQGNGGNPLVIPDSVTTMRSGAFYSYKGNGLVIGNGLKDIPERAFWNYTGPSITFGNSVRRIFENAFYSYDGEQLQFPSSLEQIQNSAFRNYTGTYGGTKHILTFPSSVSLINPNAFYSFNGQKIVFEYDANNNKGIDTFGSGAFWSYYGDDITLPNTVNHMSNFVFHSLDNTKTIYLDRTTTPSWNNVDGWNGNANVMCLDNGNPIQCQ